MPSSHRNGSLNVYVSTSPTNLKKSILLVVVILTGRFAYCLHIKMKVKPTRMFTPEEAAIAIEEASARGLPNGWTVHWDNKKRCRIWVSPCGRRKCDGIPEALAVSVKMGLLEANKMPPAYRDKMSQNRVLSREEAEHALKEARARGLPNGWTVGYNSKYLQTMSENITFFGLNVPPSLFCCR